MMTATVASVPIAKSRFKSENTAAPTAKTDISGLAAGPPDRRL